MIGRTGSTPVECTWRFVRPMADHRFDSCPRLHMPGWCIGGMSGFQPEGAGQPSISVGGSNWCCGLALDQAAGGSIPSPRAQPRVVRGTGHPSHRRGPLPLTHSARALWVRPCSHLGVTDVPGDGVAVRASETPPAHQDDPHEYQDCVMTSESDSRCTTVAGNQPNVPPQAHDAYFARPRRYEFRSG